MMYRIWKRGFHSENVSNIFRPHYDRGIWKQSFPLKMHQTFSVRTRPDDFYLGSVSEKPRLLDWLVWTLRTVEIKLCFQMSRSSHPSVLISFTGSRNWRWLSSTPVSLCCCTSHFYQPKGNTLNTTKANIRKPVMSPFTFSSLCCVV